VTLHEFVSVVENFASLRTPDKIIHFGWYLQSHGEQDRFDSKSIRSCYEKLSIEEPNLSQEFTRLMDKKPKVLLKDGQGYRLEHSIRAKLDAKYGQHETTIALSQMLKDLPGKISDVSERLFLSEVITCYHNRAFRAAIVMVWNLTYDHFLRWILGDPARTAAFNAQIIAVVGVKKGTGLSMSRREDFEDLKESDVIKIAGLAGLFVTDNTKRILDTQLTKRNMAAHPSLVAIEGPQADDAISSLVNNVVLYLK
jgi:hypothetical protein